MTYDVLVTRKVDKFIARVRQWPMIVVEGESEAEVLRQAQADLQALLAGGRIIQLELDAKPAEHPWQPFAGMFADDPDWDGFSSGVETSAGTNPLAHCGPNAWPADVNNDAFSDITGVSALMANFGLSVPPAPARQDIAPDPVDGFVDITDITKMGGFFGKTCS